MGTALGPKYIPYTYMDPLGGGLTSAKMRLNVVHFSEKKP